MRCPDILDFEASGFGYQSYPVEVGYSLADGQRYCSLIRPAPGWTYWSEEAQALHGISRQLLMDMGREPRAVCLELNERLSGRVLYSDAWVVDKAWLNRLFTAARMTALFHLSPIEGVQSECQHLLWDEVRSRMLRDEKGVRHRASIDAEFIQRVYRETQRLCR